MVYYSKLSVLVKDYFATILQFFFLSEMSSPGLAHEHGISDFWNSV